MFQVGNEGKKKEDPPLKYEAEHEILQSLERILVEGISDENSSYYIPMAQKAVMALYHFADQPDIIAGRVLKVC